MALSDELRSEIVRVADENAARFLDESAAGGVADRVAEAFIDDPTRRWWWEGARDRTVVKDYGNADGLPWIRDWIARRTDEIHLIVTDDVTPPWIGMHGSVVQVMEAIGDVWMCEFFVTPPDHSWVLFDTHQNLVVVAEKG